MKPFTHIASVVFIIVAVVHLLRIINGWPLILGTWDAPMWASWVAVIVPGILAVMIWKEARAA